MPLPRSRDAPRFNGHQLKQFLGDYELAAEEAGWSNRKMCKELYKYCNRGEADLVEQFDETNGDDWNAMRKALERYHGTDLTKKKQSKASMERFVRRKRDMFKHKQFSEYAREFRKMKGDLRDKISDEESDMLFWLGLPKVLQGDIKDQLHSVHKRLDEYIAPTMLDMIAAAEIVYDRTSLYAPLRMTLQSNKKRVEKDKKKKSKLTRFQIDDEPSGDSDTDSTQDYSLNSSDSESDHRRGQKTRRSRKTRSTSRSQGRKKNKQSKQGYYDSSSDSEASEDSDNESEDETRIQKLKSRKKSIEKEQRQLQLEKEIQEREGRVLALREGMRHPSNTMRGGEVFEKHRKPGVTELTRDLERLSLNFAALSNKSGEMHADTESQTESQMVQRIKEEVKRDLLRNEPWMNRQGIANSAKVKTQNGFNQQKDGPRSNMSCFFCKKTDSHPRGIGNCTDAIPYIQRRMIIESNGRFRMMNGVELPRAPTPLGPLVEALHKALLSQHQASSNMMMAHVGRVEAIAPEHDDVMGATINQAYFADGYWDNEATSMKIDESGPRQARKETRFSPMSKNENTSTPHEPFRTKNRAYVDLSSRPRPKPSDASGNARPPLIEKALHARPLPDRMDVDLDEPKARQERAYNSQPNKTPYRQQFDVRDPTGRDPKDNDQSMRYLKNSDYTSYLERKTDKKEVLNSIIDQKVSVSFAQLCTIAPLLNRYVGDINRRTKYQSTDETKSVPTPKQTNSLHSGYDMDTGYINTTRLYEDDEAYEAEQSDDQEYSDDNSWEHRPGTARQAYYGHTMSIRTNDKGLYAKPLALIPITIGGIDEYAMIDTGSEMNIISTDLAEKLKHSNVYDTNGSKWKIQGVNGAPEGMAGRFNSLSIVIGGKPFDHHFFFGNQSFKKYGVILGQPWLDTYECSIIFGKKDGAPGKITMRPSPYSDVLTAPLMNINEILRNQDYTFETNVTRAIPPEEESDDDDLPVLVDVTVQTEPSQQSEIDEIMVNGTLDLAVAETNPFQDTWMTLFIQPILNAREYDTDRVWYDSHENKWSLCKVDNRPALVIKGVGWANDPHYNTKSDKSTPNASITTDELMAEEKHFGTMIEAYEELDRQLWLSSDAKKHSDQPEDPIEMIDWSTYIEEQPRETTERSLPEASHLENDYRIVWPHFTDTDRTSEADTLSLESLGLNDQGDYDDRDNAMAYTFAAEVRLDKTSSDEEVEATLTQTEYQGLGALYQENMRGPISDDSRSSRVSDQEDVGASQTLKTDLGRSSTDPKQATSSTTQPKAYQSSVIETRYRFKSQTILESDHDNRPQTPQPSLPIRTRKYKSKPLKYDKKKWEDLQKVFVADGIQETPSTETTDSPITSDPHSSRVRSNRQLRSETKRKVQCQEPETALGRQTYSLYGEARLLPFEIPELEGKHKARIDTLCEISIIDLDTAMSVYPLYPWDDKERESVTGIDLSGHTWKPEGFIEDLPIRFQEGGPVYNVDLWVMDTSFQSTSIVLGKDFLYQHRGDVNFTNHGPHKTSENSLSLLSTTESEGEPTRSFLRNQQILKGRRMKLTHTMPECDAIPVICDRFPNENFSVFADTGLLVNLVSEQVAEKWLALYEREEIRYRLYTMNATQPLTTIIRNVHLDLQGRHITADFLVWDTPLRGLDMVIGTRLLEQNCITVRHSFIQQKLQVSLKLTSTEKEQSVNIRGKRRKFRSNNALTMMGTVVESKDDPPSTLTPAQLEDNRLQSAFELALCHHDERAMLQGAPDAIYKVGHVLRGKRHRDAIVMNLFHGTLTLTKRRYDIRIGDLVIPVKIDPSANYNLINEGLQLPMSCREQDVTDDKGNEILTYYENVPLTLVSVPDAGTLSSLFIEDPARFENKRYDAVLGAPWIRDIARYKSNPNTMKARNIYYEIEDNEDYDSDEDCRSQNDTEISESAESEEPKYIAQARAAHLHQVDKAKNTPILVYQDSVEFDDAIRDRDDKDVFWHEIHLSSRCAAIKEGPLTLKIGEQIIDAVFDTRTTTNWVDQSLMLELNQAIFKLPGDTEDDQIEYCYHVPIYIADDEQRIALPTSLVIDRPRKDQTTINNQDGQPRIRLGRNWPLDIQRFYDTAYVYDFFPSRHDPRRFSSQQRLLREVKNQTEHTSLYEDHIVAFTCLKKKQPGELTRQINLALNAKWIRLESPKEHEALMIREGPLTLRIGREIATIKAAKLTLYDNQPNRIAPDVLEQLGYALESITTMRDDRVVSLQVYLNIPIALPNLEPETLRFVDFECDPTLKDSEIKIYLGNDWIHQINTPSASNSPTASDLEDVSVNSMDDQNSPFRSSPVDSDEASDSDSSWILDPTGSKLSDTSGPMDKELRAYNITADNHSEALTNQARAFIFAPTKETLISIIKQQPPDEKDLWQIIVPNENAFIGIRAGPLIMNVGNRTVRAQYDPTYRGPTKVAPSESAKWLDRQIPAVHLNFKSRICESCTHSHHEKTFPMTNLSVRNYEDQSHILTTIHVDKRIFENKQYDLLIGTQWIHELFQRISHKSDTYQADEILRELEWHIGKGYNHLARTLIKVQRQPQRARSFHYSDSEDNSSKMSVDEEIAHVNMIRYVSDSDDEPLYAETKPEVTKRMDSLPPILITPATTQRSPHENLIHSDQIKKEYDLLGIAPSQRAQNMKSPSIPSMIEVKDQDPRFDY